MIPFDKTRYAKSEHPAHEFFADEFACALLMPAEDILKCRKHGMTPVEMSKRYAVPTDAVIAWLERLDKHPA